jgi:hypothetical protein
MHHLIKNKWQCEYLANNKCKEGTRIWNRKFNGEIIILTSTGS